MSEQVKRLRNARNRYQAEVHKLRGELAVMTAERDKYRAALIELAKDQPTKEPTA